MHGDFYLACRREQYRVWAKRLITAFNRRVLFETRMLYVARYRARHGQWVNWAKKTGTSVEGSNG
jgi:hypothetical protein